MNNTHAAPFVGRYRTRRDEVERIILALAVECMNRAGGVVTFDARHGARYLIDARERDVMLHVGVRAWLEARLGLADFGHDHMGDACTLSTDNAACDHCGEPATRAAHGGKGMAAYSCERCCLALQRAAAPAAEPFRVGFDIGGVLSKYPEIMRALMAALGTSRAFEVHIVSDMALDKSTAMLALNGITMPAGRLHAADYDAHGEGCKAELAKAIGLHMLIDDFVGYVATAGAPMVRLLVMPDATLPYYATSWKTGAETATFGRRVHKPAS